MDELQEHCGTFFTKLHNQRSFFFLPCSLLSLTLRTMSTFKCGVGSYLIFDSNNLLAYIISFWFESKIDKFSKISMAILALHHWKVLCCFLYFLFLHFLFSIRVLFIFFVFATSLKILEILSVVHDDLRIYADCGEFGWIFSVHIILIMTSEFLST